MMDDAKADFSRDDTRRAVKQAILLNEYLLRRAWGVLFVVIALSMFFSIFGVAILAAARLFGVAGLVATTLAATGSGLIVILWTFRRVAYTAEITHSKDVPAWSRFLGYRLLVPLWVVANAVAVSTLVLARPEVPSVFFLMHLGIAVYAYYALRLSFSKRIPGEAIIAVGSLALTSVVSIPLLEVARGTGIDVLLWAATIAIWIFSGVFARTRPIPEFAEERTGLE